VVKRRKPFAGGDKKHRPILWGAVSHVQIEKRRGIAKEGGNEVTEKGMVLKNAPMERKGGAFLGVRKIWRQSGDTTVSPSPRCKRRRGAEERPRQAHRRKHHRRGFVGKEGSLLRERNNLHDVKRGQMGTTHRSSFQPKKREIREKKGEVGPFKEKGGKGKTCIYEGGGGGVNTRMGRKGLVPSPLRKGGHPTSPPKNRRMENTGLAGKYSTKNTELPWGKVPTNCLLLYPRRVRGEKGNQSEGEACVSIRRADTGTLRGSDAISGDRKNARTASTISMKRGGGRT